MAKFKYIGDCAKGFVEFSEANGSSVKMPKGEAVEVPAKLAAKLANNSHFERVADAPAEDEPEKNGKGKKAK